MPQIIMCRSCKVPTNGSRVDGEIDRISCPTCGVFLEGDAAREVYIEQARQLRDVILFEKGFLPNKPKDVLGPFVIVESES